MSTKRELLENKLYKLIKESFLENGYVENVFPEKKSEKSDSEEKGDEEFDENKKELIMKWLDSAQELHSVLAYQLWPDKDEDSARSLFSKKYRGKDDDGKKYEFNPSELNRLYNLRDDFISDAKLNEAKLRKVVAESVKKALSENDMSQEESEFRKSLSPNYSKAKLVYQGKLSNGNTLVTYSGILFEVTPKGKLIRVQNGG